MGQLTKVVDSRVQKQMQTNRKTIHRRRYITLNEFERIKSVLLKNKIYITRSKLAMRLTNHNEYFIFDNNNKEPLLDIHHSSLSIFTSQAKKKIWHFNESIEEEIESIYERKKSQENTFSETRETFTDPETQELTLFMDNKFSDESLSSTEINYQPVEKYHLIITPFIRPLLSEGEIYDIQEAQKECTQRGEYDGDLKANTKLQQEELKGRLSRSPVKVRDLSLISDKGQRVTSPTLGTKRKENESPTGRKVGLQGDAVETKKKGRSADRKTKEPQSNKPRDKSNNKKSKANEIFRDRKSKDRGRKETDKGRIARESEKRAKSTKRRNMEDKDDEEEFDTKHKTIASESRTTNKTQSSKEKFATDKSVKSKEKMSPSRDELIKTNNLDKSKSDIHNKSKSDIHTKSKSDTSKPITPEIKLRKSLEYDPMHRGGMSVRSKSIIKRFTSETSKGSKKALSGGESKKSKKTVFDLYTIYYQLSDKKFIELGWTLEPRDSEFARIVTFQTHAAHSQNYAFRDRESIEEKFYPDGKLAYRFELNSTGKVLYTSGHPAMTFTQNYLGRRVTIFSEPTNDIVKGYMKPKLLAIFDSYGNGVVYNDCGGIRLNYDQAEGILYESRSGKPFKWQWKDYEIIQKKRMVVMLQSLRNEVANPKANKVKKPLSSKQTTRKSTHPQIIDELPYPHTSTVKLKKQKYDHTFSPIILKITNEMTLKIIGQDNIVLSYDSMKIRLRLDLGVIIEPDVEVRMDAMDVESKVENVPCVFEVLLKKTPSLVKIRNELRTLRSNSIVKYKNN